MKNKMKIVGIIAIAALIGLSMAACDTPANNDSGSSSVQLPPKRYRGVYVSGESISIYELEIANDNKAVGSAYTLYVWNKSGDPIGKGSGTITAIDGNVYTLSKGSSAKITFTDDGVTKLEGSGFADSGTITAQSTLTPLKDGGDGTINGTYKKGSESASFNGSSFTYKGGGITAPGIASYTSTILITAGIYGGDYWVVAGNYTLSGNTITFTGFSGTMGSHYSGAWTK